MKKLIKTILMAILFTIVCTISVFSYATTDEYKVKLQSDKNKYKPGETIDIVVSIEDIKLDKGIAAFSAILDYDNNIFEEVEVNEIDEWDKPILMEDMIHAIRKDMLNSKENQKVANISLKIKEDVKDSIYTINLSKFDVTDGNQEIRNDEVSIDIQVESKQVNKIEKEENRSNIYIIFAVIVAIVIVALIIIKNKKRK